jgi:hypothetical protein
MLESDRIAVIAALRDVVDATLRPDLPFVARPLTEALRVVTGRSAPAAPARGARPVLGPTRRRMLEASEVALRTLIPALPRLLRDFPAARNAVRRGRAMTAPAGAPGRLRRRQRRRWRGCSGRQRRGGSSQRLPRTRRPSALQHRHASLPLGADASPCGGQSGRNEG